MEIHCRTAVGRADQEGGADQNWMAADVRGGAVKIFHFVEVINE